MGGRRSPEYRQWLKDSVGALAAVRTEVLDGVTALADAGALVLTTNYDDLLVHALGWDVVTWRDPTRLQAVLRGREQAVVHVHGHWKDPESVVFGASSYADVLRDGPAVTFLKSAVYSRTMLFVGFGAGLGDPNFASLREWMRAELSQSVYEHYRLVRDKDLTAGLHDPAERIRSVSYGPDHADLAPFLGTLPAGLTPSGLRGLAGAGDPGPLRPVSPGAPGVPVPVPLASAEQRARLAAAAKELDRIVAIAKDQDEDAAAAAAGSGQRLDEHRRFASLFAEEIREVAFMAAVPSLEVGAADHALEWAGKLLAIAGRAGPEIRG